MTLGDLGKSVPETFVAEVVAAVATAVSRAEFEVQSPVKQSLFGGNSARALSSETPSVTKNFLKGRPHRLFFVAQPRLEGDLHRFAASSGRS